MGNLQEEKEGECFCFPVCLREVKNREATDDNDDDESIFCEGDCDSWIHRRCISLPKRALINIRSLATLFYVLPAESKNMNT